MNDISVIKNTPMRTGQVPQAILNTLLKSVCLLEIIRESTLTTKSGERHHTALCPFHVSKSRSKTLNISIDDRRFNCAECGFTGSAIGWLIYHSGLSFYEAVVEMSRRTGIDVTNWVTNESIDAARSVRQTVVDSTTSFYLEQLANSPAAQHYLQERGLSQEIVARYNIGFAPHKTEEHESFFQKQSRRHWNAGQLVRLSDGTYGMRFVNRLMFPIRNLEGHTVGYGGRTLADDHTKYLNSPSSPSFNKSTILYGLYETLTTNSAPDRLILVEGYIDVTSLTQSGVSGVVATLGTAASSSHIKTIFEHTDRLVTCFDGDEAGKKAAERLLHTALPYLKTYEQLQFAMLPEGYDPDMFVREYGVCAFNDNLDDSLFIDEFILRILTQDIDIGSIGGKAKLAASARPLVAAINGQGLRQILIDKIQDVIGIPWFDIET